MDFHCSATIGTSSEWPLQPGIHNTNGQCYEFRVIEVIPSSFRLARNNGKSVVDTPNSYTKPKNVVNLNLEQLTIIVSSYFLLVGTRSIKKLKQSWLVRILRHAIFIRDRYLNSSPDMKFYVMIKKILQRMDGLSQRSYIYSGLHIA